MPKSKIKSALDYLLKRGDSASPTPTPTPEPTPTPAFDEAAWNEEILKRANEPTGAWRKRHGLPPAKWYESDY